MKRILFVGALLIAAASRLGAIDLPELTSRDDADVMGYVHDGTKGVPGVLVTDGYSFASTDEDGAYYLASSPSAEMVYVVLPSGYEPAEVIDGVVKLFKVIDRSGGAFRADFALNPIGDDTSFSFMVHADTQPEMYFNTNVYSDLKNAYKDMQATGVALQQTDGFMPFNLHLGDIIYNTNTTVYDYSEYLNALHAGAYNVPIFATPGNHDRRYKVDYKEAMATYRSVWGPVYHSFNRGKVHFISVDNVLVVEDGSYTRGISEEAVAWMEKDLSYVAKGSRVVFMTHQPMTRNNAALKAYSGVLDMLKDYDVLILTGHLHRAYNNFPEYAPTIRERNQIALGGYEWRGPCTQDGVPNGYYIYHVDGTDISWKYKWLGKDADTNLFRVYNPGQFIGEVPDASEPKTVLVNVWDWDEDWTVTWSLDGVEQGDVPRYDAAKDPWAVYSYENISDKPTWEAKETYHMFHCEVPATGSVVEVTATDSFGRTVSKSLTLESVQGGVEAVTPESCGVETTEVYSMQGVKVLTVKGYPETDTLPIAPGCYVMKLRHTDGSLSTEKVVL